MSEYGEVDGGHENQGLSEAHQDYGQNHDASQSLEAAGGTHQIEFDEHLVHVHHVEYDDAQGNHYEETSYEVVDVHVVETESNVAVGGTDSAQSYGDISFIHEDLEQLLSSSSSSEFGGSEFGHGFDEQSLFPGGSDADGVSGISEASA